MMQPKPIRTEPVTGKRVTKLVTLSDGRVIEFPVFEVDPPKDRLVTNKVRLKADEGLGFGAGWVRRRRSM